MIGDLAHLRSTRFPGKVNQILRAGDSFPLFKVQGGLGTGTRMPLRWNLESKDLLDLLGRPHVSGPNKTDLGEPERARG